MASSGLLPGRFVGLFAPQTLSVSKPIFVSRTEASRSGKDDGSGNIHRYKYSWQAAAGSRLKLSFAVCVWLHSDKPSPAALCCLGCSEGWMATGQQIHWPDWNISRVKSSKCLFLCVPCCPSPGPEALLGWAGPGGSLISWEGKPRPLEQS